MRFLVDCPSHYSKIQLTLLLQPIFHRVIFAYLSILGWSELGLVVEVLHYASGWSCRIKRMQQ